jgi:hypothetical protein
MILLLLLTISHKYIKIEEPVEAKINELIPTLYYESQALDTITTTIMADTMHQQLINSIYPIANKTFTEVSYIILS